MGKQYHGNIWILMALAGLLNCIMPISMATVDPSCDYYQNMVLGQQYYIYNQEYSNNYSGQVSCRWVAESPFNTRIVLSCEDVNIPPTTNCQGDHLSVSLTGDPDFGDAHNYCGKGSFSLVTEDNRLSVGLFAGCGTTGGKYLCSLAAISSGGPTTTTTTPKPPTCDCGWRQTRRIVGGEETGVNEFPSMGALINLVQKDLYCGATIIAVKYGVTAAHCVVRREPQNLGLLVGDHDISTGSDTPAAALYILERIVMHPDYVDKTLENDIAIVVTQNIMAFTAEVGPACLPFRYTQSDFATVNVLALGWGTTEFTGPKSDVLLAVNLTVLTNSDCQLRNRANILWTQLCTYTKDKDTCQSDSGGPLLWWDTTINRLQFVGIVSFGVACASDEAGVNTRITSYLAWIISQTSDADYCIK